MFPWRSRKVVWLALIGLAIACGVIVVGLLTLDTRRPAKPPAVCASLGAKVTEPKVAAGGLHLVVLAEDGSLWGTGADFMGQLGQNGGAATGTASANPAQSGGSFRFSPLRRFVDTNLWIDVAVTQAATIGLRRDGTVWSWGYPTWPDAPMAPVPISQIGVDMNWKRIAGGSSHVVLLRGNGELWVRGTGKAGQFGDGASGSTTNLARIGSGSTWRDVSAYGSTSAAIDQDGSLWAWGSVIGIGTNSLPREIPFPITRVGDPSVWKKAELQVNAVVAQDLNGDLWRMEIHEDLALAAPVKLPVLTNGILSFAASSRAVVAIDRLGKTWIYGNNLQQVLGADREKGFSDWTLLDAGGSHRFVAMADLAGAAIGDDGVVTWGRRYDAYELRAQVPFLELRRWLSKLGSLFPKPTAGYTYLPYFEPKPWSLMQFTRTNRIDAGVGP